MVFNDKSYCITTWVGFMPPMQWKREDFRESSIYKTLVCG
jgi:hypothetical protein